MAVRKVPPTPAPVVNGLNIPPVATYGGGTIATYELKEPRVRD